ncbi:MAG: hypothetical protein ACXVX6_05350 [Mycobacterium sp.]
MKKAIMGASAAAAIALASTGIPPAHADDGIIIIIIPGFSPDTCTPSANPSPTAISSQDCVNNTMPGGPPFARVVQFADQSKLNNEFQTDARSTALQPCPGSSDSAPATWNATNPPPASGSVMCYTSSDNMAHVEWTNTTDLVKVDASGPDMATLYGWWHGLITTL